MGCYKIFKNVFQSTPSVGRATAQTTQGQETGTISIHTLRGEGDFSREDIDKMTPDISIHTLRGEGDYNGFRFYAPNFISIHTLRGEGDSIR